MENPTFQRSKEYYEQLNDQDYQLQMPINIQAQNRGRQSQNIIFNNSSVSSGSFMLNSSYQQDQKDSTNQVSDKIFVLEREVSDLHVKYKFLLDQCEQKSNIADQNVNDPEKDHYLHQIRMEVSLIADSLLSKESLLNDLKSQQSSHVQSNDKLRNSFQNDQDFQNNGNRRFQRNNQQQMYNVLNQKSQNPNYQNSLIVIDGKEQKQNFDSEMFGSQQQMSEISQINAYHNMSQNQSGNTINNLSSSLRNHN